MFLASIILSALSRPTLLPVPDLPPRAVVLSAREFNREYRQYLKSHIRLARFEEQLVLIASYREAERLWGVWDKIDDIQRLGPTEAYMLQNHLKSLLNLVGVQVYYTGTWPPPVPVWDFYIW